MRTEDDIRRALDVEPDQSALSRLSRLAESLDDGDTSLVGAGIEVRRPRRVLPLLAAAVVVAAVGGATTLVQLQHREAAAGGSGAHRLTAFQRRPTWNLRIGHVPGYTVTRVSASSIGLATGSLFTVTSTDVARPEHGRITTCPGRSLAACSDTVGRRYIRVDGRQGTFQPGRRDTHNVRLYLRRPWLAASQGGSQPGIAYYAGHHTVVFISGTFGFEPLTHAYDNRAARAILLRLAAATSTGRHDPASLPFALRDLPGRVAPESVVLGLGACSDYGTGPVSLHDALGTVFTACRERTGATRAATIDAADHVSPSQIGSVAGFDPDAIVVHDFPDGTSIVISVGHGQSTVVSRQRARYLAAHADVSPDLDDPSTWIVVR